MRAAVIASAILASAGFAAAATVSYTPSSSASWLTSGATAFQTTISSEQNGARVRWRTSTGEDDNDIGALFLSGASGAVQTISVHVPNTSTAIVINDNSKPMTVDFFSADVTGDVNGKPTMGPGGYVSMGTASVTLTSGPYAGDNDPGFLTFTVADQNWQLESGKWYAFLLGMNEEVSTDYYRVNAWAWNAVSDSYEIRREANYGGTRPYGTTTGIDVFGTDGTRTGTGSRDISFEVAVPEPVSLSLLGVAGTLLMARRRK